MQNFTLILKPNLKNLILMHDLGSFFEIIMKPNVNLKNSI